MARWNDLGLGQLCIQHFLCVCVDEVVADLPNGNVHVWSIESGYAIADFVRTSQHTDMHKMSVRHCTNFANVIRIHATTPRIRGVYFMIADHVLVVISALRFHSYRKTLAIHIIWCSPSGIVVARSDCDAPASSCACWCAREPVSACGCRSSLHSIHWKQCAI